MSYLDSLHAGKRARLLKLAAAGAAARPGPPAASVASALSPADAARLRVRAQALSDENASLRRNLQSLAQQAKRVETELAALRSRAQQRERHAAEQHAEQHAALEEQAQRQQRALLDLARTAGGVARENVELHARLAALQDENDSSRCSQAALQGRLAQLQGLCLELDRQGAACGAAGPADAAQPPGDASRQQAELLERLTCTLRGLGPVNSSAPLGVLSPGQHAAPPPLAPGKVEAAARGLPTDLRLALRQLEALRRERDGLAGKLKAADAQLAKLRAETEGQQAALVRERHAAAAATADLQRQLKAARARTEGMAQRCKEREAALAERSAYVAALEQRLLQRRQQATGATHPASSAPASSAAGLSNSRPAAGAAPTPGAHALAALSPAACSPGALMDGLHQEQQQLELSLASLQQAATATAAVCRQGGWPEDGWEASPFAGSSPGADSTIPASSPQRDLPPRRLQWAGPAQQGQQAEDGWAAYELCGASPCAYELQAGSPCPAATNDGMSCNPLFSFCPGLAVRSGAADSPARPAGVGQAGSTPAWCHNDLYCGTQPAPAAGLQLPPHQRPAEPAQRGGASPPPPGCRASSSPDVLAPRGSPGAALPPRMPSGEFPSVSALLDALMPGSQAALLPAAAQRASAAGPGRGSPVPGKTAAALQAMPPPAAGRPGSGALATDGMVERKLQDAVACFFAESAQKAAPPILTAPGSGPGHGQRRGQPPGTAERLAALSSAAKRQRQQQQQQQQRAGPAAAQEAEPATKNGRPNRAADQRLGASRQRGGGAWSPGRRMGW